MKNKFLLLSSMLVLSAIQVSSLHAQQKNEPGKTNLPAYNATIDDNDTQINYSEDGHRYKIRLDGSKVVEMYVDGKKIPAEDFAKYEATVKKILEQIEKDRQQAQKDREQAEKDREQAQKDRETAEKDRAQAEKDREQAIRDREQSQKDRERAEGDRKQAEKDRAQATADRAQAEKDRAQAEKDRAQAELDRKQAEVDRKQAEEDRKLFRAMLSELVTDKLIDDEDALRSLTLDESEFSVNGVKQPENLRAKYETKYLKGRHKKISYKNSGNVRGMSFN